MQPSFAVAQAHLAQIDDDDFALERRFGRTDTDERADVEVHVLGEEKAGVPIDPPPGALDRAEDQVLSKHVKAVFWCWIVLFALVGSQMGWVLRPFIGNPDRPFSWFRERDSNFFQAVLRSMAGVSS